MVRLPCLVGCLRAGGLLSDIVARVEPEPETISHADSNDPADSVRRPHSRAIPGPVPGQAVYDEAAVLSPEVEADLETQIDAIQARSGAEVVVYLQIDPDATDPSNVVAARALMDQWGIGCPQVGDGFVILVSFEENTIHGVLTTYAGPGLLEHLPEDSQARLRDEVIIPAFQASDPEEGILRGVAFVDEAIP